ncbi:hypothetical protein EVAR_15007_1 [Eumeta japonica]|uniref:Uncharacterized protein n=1 Tax=Eumeta variegata TaxID=151549 RepID=A0A4C1X5H3_EUMVA|nr:hypothetical protein EVAR_15007_1 [Eumeta japonica]
MRTALPKVPYGSLDSVASTCDALGRRDAQFGKPWIYCESKNRVEGEGRRPLTGSCFQMPIFHRIASRNILLFLGWTYRPVGTITRHFRCGDMSTRCQRRGKRTVVRESIDPIRLKFKIIGRWILNLRRIGSIALREEEYPSHSCTTAINVRPLRHRRS